MRIIFMGSAELSCPSLKRLAESGEGSVVAVVTQPDRPRGRRLQVAPSVVKALAQTMGLPVLTPSDANDAESVAAVAAFQPDLIAVVAYGQILRDALLTLPPLGCLNLHTSLLPRYRGAAPIQWAIANGDTVTGVTTMFMNARMDAGDILYQRELPIADGDTAGTLHDGLAEVGADLLVETVRAIRLGQAKRLPQPAEGITFAPKLTKADGRIDWTRPAHDIHNRVRGFNPWPCCFCHVQVTTGRQAGHVAVLRVLETRAVAGEGAPGTVICAGEDGPVVAAGTGAVALTRVQAEGARAMTGAAYLHGHALEAGDVLR